MNTKSLKNKTVWITGGKRIGQSVAEELASLGANIVASYRSSKEEAVQEFVDTVVRLCFVRSSGSVYPLDLGHLW